MLAELLRLIGRGPDDVVPILSKLDSQPGMRTDWCRAADADATADAAAAGGTRHVWFGVQPITAQTEHGRGTAGDVQSVITLYADIDYKPGFADAETAALMISDLSDIIGSRPVAVVLSGGGVQPYWPLATPLDPLTGAVTLFWWRTKVLQVAEARGARVDTGVYNLDRILRAPGPPNVKAAYITPETPTGAPTRLLAGAGAPITREQLDLAMQSYPSPESATFASTGVFSPTSRGVNVEEDRLFTPAEMHRYLYENPGFLAKLGETPERSGFNTALLQAAGDLAAAVPAFYSPDEADAMLEEQICKVFPGGRDSVDQATINSAIKRCNKTFREPTPVEAMNPFRPFADTDAIWRAQGSKVDTRNAGAKVEAEPVYEVVEVTTETDRKVGRYVYEAGPRRVSFVAASDIQMRATRWLWRHGNEHWIPLGGLVLLGGREGMGKSSWTARLVAQVTLGKMEGHYLGQPKGVVICATEDAWDTTIIPRLRAAGANLDLVYRTDAEENEITAGLVLPTDVVALENFVREHDVAMIVLDPLLGTIATKLDAHNDRDVRQALEPLSRLAHNCGATVLGLIHQNKSSSGDLLTKLMGSRAFAAVARAVVSCAFVGHRTDDDGTPIDVFLGDGGAPGPRQFAFGQLKNNLHAKVETSIRYEIETATVGFDSELAEPIVAAKVRVVDYADTMGLEELDDTRRKSEDGRRKPDGSKIDQCKAWISKYLIVNGRTPSDTVKKEAEATGGFSTSVIKRAAAELHLDIERPDPENRHWTTWDMPDSPDVLARKRKALADLTSARFSEPDPDNPFGRTIKDAE